jgi:PST family polysaccharide transporter
LPYVVRIIGPAKYGLINFAAAFIAYFNLISDYGFNLSGTKEISLVRNDREKLSKSFSTILFIKLILSALLFVVFILIIFLIPFFSQYRELYLLSYGMVVGLVLFPSWFYQGIEEMKYITIIQVIIRSVSTVLIFVFIKVEADFLMLVFLNSSAQVLIGILGLFIALYKFKIKFKLPDLKEIKLHLKEGWNLFQSTIAINIYTTSNTFILGLFASETIVGYFAAADKIRLAFQGIQSVMSQAVFPYVNHLLKESRQKYLIFIKRIMKLQIAAGFFISMFLLIFSSELCNLLLGEQFQSSVMLLRIISPLPFIIAISNVYGIQIMLPMGFENVFSKIITSAAIMHIVLLMVFVPKYFAVGTSTIVVVTEIIVTILMWVFVRNRKLIANKPIIPD